MLKLKIENMTCNHCISMITKAIVQWQADAKVEVDLAKQFVKIDSKLSEDEILHALDEAGYPAVVAGSCCSMQMKCRSNL